MLSPRSSPLPRRGRERIAGAELREVAKHAEKGKHDLPRFRRWCASFYESHRAYVAQVVAPLLEASGAPAERGEAIAAALCDDAEAILLQAADPAAAADEFDRNRAGQVRQILVSLAGSGPAPECR